MSVGCSWGLSLNLCSFDCNTSCRQELSLGSRTNQEEIQTISLSKEKISLTRYSRRNPSNLDQTPNCQKDQQKMPSSGHVDELPTSNIVVSQKVAQIKGPIRNARGSSTSVILTSTQTITPRASLKEDVSRPRLLRFMKGSNKQVMVADTQNIDPLLHPSSESKVTTDIDTIKEVVDHKSWIQARVPRRQLIEKDSSIPSSKSSLYSQQPLQQTLKLGGDSSQSFQSSKYPTVCREARSIPGTDNCIDSQVILRQQNPWQSSVKTRRFSKNTSIRDVFRQLKK